MPVGGVLDHETSRTIRYELGYLIGQGNYTDFTPEQLLKLLTVMAHHKLVSQARKQYARRRDERRVVSVDIGGMLVSGDRIIRGVEHVLRRRRPDVMDGPAEAGPVEATAMER